MSRRDDMPDAQARTNHQPADSLHTGGNAGGHCGAVRPHLAVLGAYILLTLILTYPLILRLTSHIPGGNVDESGFLWNTWWFKHALLYSDANPLTTDLIFYPLGMDLTLNTMAWLNCALALPLTLTVGPIAATNVLFLLAFVLSGFGMYLLALDVLRDPAVGRAFLPDVQGSAQSVRRARMPDLQAPHLAAFIAGVIYAFASARFLYAALGHYNFVSSQWLPLAVLFLLRTLRRPGRRAPVLAGIFCACAGLSEFNFIVYLALFVAIVLVYLLLRRRDLLTRAVAGRLALALLVFLAGFGLLGLAVLRAGAQAGDSLVRGWGGADRFLIDALGPFVPSTLHPLFGAWAVAATRRFSDINFGFIGYLTLLLAAIGARAGLRPAPTQRSGLGEQATESRAEHGRSGAKPSTLYPLPSTLLWLVVALVFLILALGPLLHVNGQSEFEVDGLTVSLPLPYLVVHYLPILKGARVPGRFAIMATLAVAVLAAMGCRAVMQRIRGQGWQALAAGIMVAVIIGENMALPLRLTNVTAPEPYRRIAADSRDGAILQIPVGWREGFGTLGRERTLYQAYQIVHQKPLLSGQTARSPAYVLPYFSQTPILRSIIALQDGNSLDAATVEADRAQAAIVLAFLNVRYIVVHGDEVGGPVDTYIQSVLPVDRVAEGNGETENSFWRLGDDGKWVETKAENAAWVLYAVRTDTVQPATVIDLGTPAAQMHLAAGWSRPETMDDITFSWAESRQALALVRLDQPAAATLSLRAAPFSYAGAPVQRVEISVNGHEAGALTMQDGWQEYRLPVPPSSLRSGINQIRLSFAHSASPAQVMGSSDRRTLAAAVDWIRLE